MLAALSIVSDRLPPTKSNRVRSYAWLAGVPHEDGRIGTLTVWQRRTPTSRTEESDTYAVAEDVRDDLPPGVRVFLLANLSDPDADRVYETALTPEGDYCDCTAGQCKVSGSCKHRDSLRALLDAGDLDPPALLADPPPRVEPKPAPAADPGPELHPIRTFRRLRLDEVPF